MATMYIEAQWEDTRRQTRRKGRRSSVWLPAMIMFCGRRHTARLHNLSCGGAMIQSAVPVRTDDQIVLTCGTIEVLGRIVWVKKDCFGIEFLTPIEEEEIVRQLGRCNALMSRQSLRQETKADLSSS